MTVLYIVLVTISNGPQCGNVHERGEGADSKQVSYHASSICAARGGEKHAREDKGHN
jgi:carbamate kinase